MMGLHWGRFIYKEMSPVRSSGESETNHWDSKKRRSHILGQQGNPVHQKVTFEKGFTVSVKFWQMQMNEIAKKIFHARNISSNRFAGILVVFTCASKNRILSSYESSIEALCMKLEKEISSRWETWEVRGLDSPSLFFHYLPPLTP